MSARLPTALSLGRGAGSLYRLTGTTAPSVGKAALAYSKAEQSYSWCPLGDAASRNVGTGVGDVAAGNHSHDFSTLTGKPTTLGGYGITDSLTSTDVDARFSALIGAAPAALDTLVELATALQGEQSALGALTTVVGTKITQAQGDARYSLLGHASRHAVGGADPLAPSDIGALSQNDFAAFQSTLGNAALKNVGSGAGDVAPGNYIPSSVRVGDLLFTANLYNTGFIIKTATSGVPAELTVGNTGIYGALNLYGTLSASSPHFSSGYLANSAATLQGSAGQVAPLLLMQMPSNTGTLRDASAFTTALTDTSDASFSADVVIQSALNGAMVERLRLGTTAFINSRLKVPHLNLDAPVELVVPGTQIQSALRVSKNGSEIARIGADGHIYTTSYMAASTVYPGQVVMVPTGRLRWYGDEESGSISMEEVTDATPGHVNTDIVLNTLAGGTIAEAFRVGSGGLRVNGQPLGNAAFKNVGAGAGDVAPGNYIPSSVAANSGSLAFDTFGSIDVSLTPGREFRIGNLQIDAQGNLISRSLGFFLGTDSARLYFGQGYDTQLFRNAENALGTYGSINLGSSTQGYSLLASPSSPTHFGVIIRGAASQGAALLMLQQRSNTGTVRESTSIDSVPTDLSDASFSADTVFSGASNGGLSESVRLRGKLIRWNNLVAGDVAGLDWWHPGSFGARLRMNDAGRLVLYHTGNGPEVPAVGFSLIGDAFFTGSSMSLGKTDSTSPFTLQGYRYTASQSDSLALATYAQNGGGFVNRLVVTGGGANDIAQVRLESADLSMGTNVIRFGNVALWSEDGMLKMMGADGTIKTLG